MCVYLSVCKCACREKEWKKACFPLIIKGKLVGKMEFVIFILLLLLLDDLISIFPGFGLFVIVGCTGAFETA